MPSGYCRRCFSGVKHKASAWTCADIITLSGNGEPTLAANIGEVIREIKALTLKPVLLLTNSAHLSDQLVRREISAADRIFCKLDAAEEKTFRKIDRPVQGITLRRIVDGIKMLRAEYNGFLAIQTMLTQINRNTNLVPSLGVCDREIGGCRAIR